MHDQPRDDPGPYEISVACEAGIPPINDQPLRRAIELTLQRHACASATLSVALIDDAQIAAVNEKYLGHEGPTDVMSFNLGDGGDGLDGEILVSVETAQRQCERRGHSLDGELALYVVHGTLHLLGLDDRTDAEAEAMHDEEDRILMDLGYGAVYHGGRR